MSAASNCFSKRIAILWLAALALAAAGWMLPAASARAEAQVVYHADFSDPRRFSAMLTSINNMITTYKSELREYDVRIVFVAYGIRSPITSTRQLHKQYLYIT